MAGELNRRQQILRAVGLCQRRGIRTDARRAGAQLMALPTLFIIVDEFSELLSQHPDFADMFVAIGRLGRSLGMHLLLASQRLDEGRLRGLEAHLSYRFCLKTLSASESRAVLGTLDAYPIAEYARRRFPALQWQRAYPLPDRIRFGTAPSGTRGRCATAAASPSVQLFSTRAAGPSHAAPRRLGRPTRTVCGRSWTGYPGRDRPRTKSGCRRWVRHRAWWPCCATPDP